MENLKIKSLRVHFLYVLDNDNYAETGLKKSFVPANFLLKLFSCAVVFMLICHENMRLVQGERSRENLF